jgi:hypothetical protein
MILCPLEAFGINGETAPGSPCYLSGQCANRYSNLFSTRYAGKSLKEGDIVKIKTIRDEGFLYTNAGKAENGAFALGFTFISLVLFTL